MATKASGSESDKTGKYLNLPLNGKLITSIDGTELGEGDFQVLKNMRYGTISPSSISGMTKINSAVINATYLKPRNGFHFRKYLPAESHLLVQSWNTGLTAGLVYENTAVIPAAGDFTAAALWTDTASSNVGHFSDAPDGCIIYCNGKDSCVWGGNEYRVGAFLVGDLEETVKYDYTERVTNTLTDSANVATITKVGTDSGNDTNAVLLLNCNGVNGGTTFGDSSVGAAVVHNATAVGNTNTSTAALKFGTASAYFDGTGDYLTVVDHGDFDFSGGTWTIDMWIKPTAAAGTPLTLYYHGTDANNYMQISMNRLLSDDTFTINLKIVAASSTVVTLTSGYQWNIGTAFHHFEFVEDGDNWYIFKDGSKIASTTDTSRAANYTGSIYIGANSGGTGTYIGYIDEIRVSKTARHIANFSPPTAAYSGTANAYVFVASTRPIKGIKFYVGTANVTPCVPTVSYWANSTWTVTTNLVDGTASPAGTSLGKTGSITFDTTVSLAKARVYNSVYAYWYLISFPAIDNTTTVYYATLDSPMQQIIDLWDGSARPIMNYFKYVTSYTDETTNVIYQNYLATDTLTYSDLGLFATTSYILCGFGERMTGVEIILASGTANTAVGSVIPYYWDGSTWVELSGVNDKTSGSSASLNQSGTITWDSPSEALEFRSSFSSSDNWYFYKLAWSSVTTASVNIDLITGITASKTIKSHSYPVIWQNRVWMLDEYQGYRNSALCSAQDTICVFNGSDSTTLYFGGDEPLTGGSTLFTRFGGSVYDNLVTYKRKEVWLVDGSDPSSFIKYKISEEYGCVAPETLKKVDLGYEIAAGLTKHILIWQAENAICVFDGNAVINVSDDIKNYFDRTKSECIPTSMLSKSYGFYDSSNYEYHWLFASGSGATTLNKEFVYDLLKKKWYEIERGTGKYIQIGIEVMDTYGQKYTYGGIDTGYIERLEYGNTFDGNNIVSQFRTRDFVTPSTGWNMETMVRHFRLILVAKGTSTAKVIVTHYGDTILTSVETATNAFAVLNATKRVLKPTESVHWGPNLYHSFNCSLTTSNEVRGFEPIGIGIIYKVIRESIL